MRLDQAQRWKRLINEAKLNFEGQPVVGVIRPPLRTPAFYGVAIGMSQPSGQVRFTYDRRSGEALKNFISSVQQLRGAFTSTPFLEEPPQGRAPGPCESEAIGN